MKNLLILLALGLMFGATIVESRSYTIDVSNGDTFDLVSLTGYNLSSIVGEGVAGVNVNGTWVGSLTQLQAGSGYWFKSSIEACFNYECAENYWI